jgi:hypothetical protein
MSNSRSGNFLTRVAQNDGEKSMKRSFLALNIPCQEFIVVVIVITNQDLTSSRLLPDSSYSCCIRNLHALAHKLCHPVHITTAHEVLQRRKWQLCKSTLPPNHSGSWTRKEKVGFVIHRKVVHSQSCTSLAATRKPNHSLMPAKFPSYGY